MRCQLAEKSKKHCFPILVALSTDIFAILALSWLILASKTLPRRSKMAQYAFKRLPRAPKTRPRRLHDRPRRRSEASRRRQDGPEHPPDAFKRCSTGPKINIWHEFSPGFVRFWLLSVISSTVLFQNGLHDVPKTAKIVSKTTPDVPKRPLGASKTTYNRFQDAAYMLPHASQNVP